MRKLRRVTMPIYLILGVLSLMACVSIAISSDESDADSKPGISAEIEFPNEEESDDDIILGEDDAG